jgi:hypothetical protein
MNLTPSHIVCLGDEISIEGVPEGAKAEWKTSSYYDYIKLSDTRIKLTSFASINFSSVPIKAFVTLGRTARL